LLLKDPEEKEKFFQVFDFICYVKLLYLFIHTAIEWVVCCCCVVLPHWSFRRNYFPPGCFPHGFWAWIWQRSASVDAGFPVQTGEASPSTGHSTGTRASVANEHFSASVTSSDSKQIDWLRLCLRCKHVCVTARDITSRDANNSEKEAIAANFSMTFSSKGQWTLPNSYLGKDRGGEKKLHS